MIFQTHDRQRRKDLSRLLNDKAKTVGHDNKWIIIKDVLDEVALAYIA
jgi:hypothetical protein